MKSILLNGLCIGALLASVAYAADSKLADAAAKGDKTAVRALLKEKADVNAAQPDGTTALHWAAHLNDAEMVDLLLKAGANAQVPNRYGVTALSEAAVSGSGALIERLLKAGADPNTLTTEEGETVLMTASRSGNVEAVKALLDHGAKVNSVEAYRGQTALMWAAAQGHPEVVKMLLAKGADANVYSTNRDTTEPKLPSGSPVAPIPRGGMTALLFAARQGEIECMKALLDGGVDINQVDVDSNNALTFAILNTHYDAAQFLIERGANVNLANKTGRAALYVAIDVHDADTSPRPDRKEVDKLTSMDIIKSLVEHGANVNAELSGAAPVAKFAQDHGDRTLAAGATPFLRAARSSDLELMRYLVSKGADPKAKTKDGLTALTVAAGVGWQDKVRGEEKEALATVKYCIELGLDVNAATEKGDTAMHGAAVRGADNLVQFLADHGAKVNVKNKSGLTPYDIAKGKGGFQGALRVAHESTAALILKLGGQAGSMNLTAGAAE